MRHLGTTSVIASLVATTTLASAATLTVGPGKAYPKPCTAIAAARAGDVIEIDAAGNYAGEVCGWGTDNLTLRGVGGRPRIDGQGTGAQGKAIWVVGGDDTLIENIEFTGAAVADLNGAGLRLDGANTTVRGCYFHDNQEGILGGAGTVLIERSELARNGNCIDESAGCAHNLYISELVTKTNQGTALLAGNFVGDPSFLGLATLDVRLAPGSPAIGKGVDPGATTGTGTNGRGRSIRDMSSTRFVTPHLS